MNVLVGVNSDHRFYRFLVLVFMFAAPGVNLMYIAKC